MIIAAIQQVSLSDVPPTSAITSASSWISVLLFGQLATIIAVVAIAWVGFAMLSGRVNIRHGLSVLFGCFLLFGARGIADGLTSDALYDKPQSITGVPPPPVNPDPSLSAGNANAFDPYAGELVRRPSRHRR